MQTTNELNWIKPDEILEDITTCKGDFFNNTFYKLKKIISYQFNNSNIRGIKGFVFYGNAGTGKTTLAKLLGKHLHYPVLFIDGRDVARSLYGESEQKIQEIFQEAKTKKSIILIDDAESVFPSREWSKGQSWHSAQNNILLHELDKLDASRTIVIMTTNKYHLLDDALKDRVYNIEFPNLTKQDVMDISEEKCQEKGVDFNELKPLIEKMDILSVRTIEKFIEEKFIEKVMKEEK